MHASELFTLSESLSPFAGWFDPGAPPWRWVAAIAPALAEWFSQNPPEPRRSVPPGCSVAGDVYVHPEVRLPAFGFIQGPAWIGRGCELRPGVYIRGNVITGEDCVLGNSCEFKNCLLMNKVQVPHFSYVGDSILGSGVHLGAGAILSNFRFDQGEVPVTTPEGRTGSGLRKLGGLLGEYAELGCNAVLQPGTILGKRAIVMTGLVYSGYLEPETLAYTRTAPQRVRRRDLA